MQDKKTNYNQIDSKQGGTAAAGEVVIDEDNMYLKPVIIGQKKDEPRLQKVVPEDTHVVKVVPEDTHVVFARNEFLYLDYQQDTWAQGDVQTVDSSPLSIAENSSLVRVDTHGCKDSTLFVSGGVYEAGSILNWAFGINF